MHVVLVGIAHHTAPVALRERVASTGALDALAILAQETVLLESLVLSTCNRFEVYGVCDSATQVDDCMRRIAKSLAERAQVSDEELHGHLFTLADGDAVQHLFAVAAGRRSMVLGETQIVSQLKRALADARHAGTLGAVLHRLGTNALNASRRARARVERSGAGAARSMSSVAVDVAMSDEASRDGRIVVVGAGESAADVLTALAARGTCRARVTVVNRTAERAEGLARRFHTATADWAELSSVVRAADIVFCCTSAPTPVVTADMLALWPRVSPLTLIDLGVPRNVAPDAAALANVRIVDVDQLCGPAAPSSSQNDEAVEREIELCVRQFELWMRRRDIVPTLSQLQTKAEQMRDRELERLRAQLPDLDERELAMIANMSRRLVNQMLHRPLATLAAHPDSDELTRSARRLFDLGT